MDVSNLLVLEQRLQPTEAQDSCDCFLDQGALIRVGERRPAPWRSGGRTSEVLPRDPPCNGPLLFERGQWFVGMMSPDSLISESSGDLARESTQLLTS